MALSQSPISSLGKPSDGLAAGDFRRFLQEELLRRCKINPRYSLRRFALRLGVDASLLSKILNGKRPTGPKTIRRFGSTLGLSPDEIESFLVYHQRSSQPSAPLSPKEDNYRQLTEDTYQVLSDWHHYAILELMRVQGFKPSTSWIATRLGLSESEINEAVECLQRLDLLQVSPEGMWTDLTGGKTTTLGHSHLTQLALKTLQAKLLAKAMETLADVPLEVRNHSSMTMAIDVSRIGAAKKMIQEFQRDLSKLLSRGRGEKTAVYNLSVALFPLSDNSQETQNQRLHS